MTGNREPVKNPLDPLVTGYPKLAGYMEVLPEIAIFRRFGALNARNLLYLQSELCTIERMLINQEKVDSVKGGNQGKYALDWFWLSQSEKDGDTAQLELVIKMRQTLKEYNEALIQQTTIQNLNPPDNWDLREIQGFLQEAEMGPLALLGPDASIWGSYTQPKGHAPDFVAVRPRQKEDPFSDWLSEYGITFLAKYGFIRWMKPLRLQGRIGTRDGMIFRITLWIAGMLASVIPLVSIVVLYCVHPMAARLSIIGAFNLFISFCLGLFTNAKRSEIFAVSGAFTAVQVVFINTGSTK